jgi:hypothetical protein
MEYWNVGIMDLAELDLFYVHGKEQKIKSDQHPLLIPNIPFFQYSIIPWVLERPTPPLSPSCRLSEPEAGVKSKPGLLGQDSLLIR